jgi:hypothetical protein
MGLEGTWYNELGSTLVITQVDKDGTVSGTYETVVSNGCAKGVFAVTGRTDIDGGGATVGFAVTWVNAQSKCNSTTTWAGQYRGPMGQESLTAVWLLVMKTDVEDSWASTLVGEDVFTRQVASPERQAKAAARKRHSHP